MAETAPVIIADYAPEWPGVFDGLREVIGGAAGELALTIEHVGSTSVPGLAAKPIIDLDVVIRTAEQLLLMVECLARLGYVHQGDLGIPGREAFTRDGEDVPRDGSGRRWMEHHLYVCVEGGRELRRHLAFRDLLRADAGTAAAYAELKRRLGVQFRHDREAYCEAKSEFIERALAGGGHVETGNDLLRRKIDGQGQSLPHP